MEETQSAPCKSGEAGRGEVFLKISSGRFMSVSWANARVSKLGKRSRNPETEITVKPDMNPVKNNNTKIPISLL
jgi:hypothetical protein